MLALLLAAVQITYVANEGFLLSAGDDAVLIDALQSGGIAQYAAPSEETLEALRKAGPPFSGVDLVLVSHSHVDHFDPSAVADHLAGNPGAKLISTSEMVEPVAERGGEAVETVAYPDGTGRSRRTIGGITVEIFRLDHSGYPEPRYRLQNLGHLVTIGGKKILHVGDAELSAENFARHRLVEEEIDIALLPYWYLLSEEGRRLVHEHIRPRRIIAIHVPPLELESIANRLKTSLPDTVVFERPMQTLPF